MNGVVFSEWGYLEGASVGLTVGLAEGSLVGVLVGAKVGALGMMVEGEGREGRGGRVRVGMYVSIACQ